MEVILQLTLLLPVFFLVGWMKTNAFLPCYTLTNIHTWTLPGTTTDWSVAHWALQGLRALIKGNRGKWCSFTSLSRFWPADSSMTLQSQAGRKESHELYDGLQLGDNIFKHEDLVWKKKIQKCLWWLPVDHIGLISCIQINKTLSVLDAALCVICYTVHSSCVAL